MPQVKTVPRQPTILKPDQKEPNTPVFRVSGINEGNCQLVSYNRRDFYKISLILDGSSVLQYADRDIRVTGPALVFTNPLVPYSWDEVKGDTSGFFCVFTNDFLVSGGKMDSLQDSGVFKPGGDPVYLLDQSKTDYLVQLFSRMREEMNSDYIYKYDLIRSQVNLIMHEAIKMQPAVAFYRPPNAASRISRLFLDLLDRQFPIESVNSTMALKKPAEFAGKLLVHVNHLNAMVREITGKSTTTHINERIVAEARSLLIHTNWSVAEIGYTLGFEYPSYFNNFFRKQTGITPLVVRNAR